MDYEESDVETLLTRIRKNATSNLLRAWNEVTGTARAIIGTLDPNLPKQDLTRLHQQMCDCINPKGGEITARHNTVKLGKIYLGLSEAGKEKFLLLLLEKFDVDYQKIKEIFSLLKEDFGYNQQQELEQSIRAPRHQILKQFLSLSNGLKFVVDMRADILKLLKKNPDLSKLENDLRNILSTWFDIGLLDMKTITWDSPASMLEKLIAYEAVHKITSWNDLRNRLDSDRRCFAFFHYKMPAEPLIFIEVALTNDISNSVQSLLDESAPITDKSNINTAMFYSISSAQPGLTGINLGNFLIKHVVQQLIYEFPKIKYFVTISPIPGFIKWLNSNIDNLQINQQIKDKIQQTCIQKGEANDVIKQQLISLCAYYLLKIKRNLKALDPVANFHLSNGASIRQIHWNADQSEKGWKQSCGIMVNYHYEINKIDYHYERYISKGIISSARSLESLSKTIKMLQN